MDRIYDLFLVLGIHSTYLGSRYLHYAITLCLNNEDYLLCVCHLYDIVASNFGVRRYNVERCIRTAVTHCYDQGNREFLEQIAKRPLDARPTNGEFIDILCHYLKSVKG